MARGELTNKIKADLIQFGVVDIPLFEAGDRADRKLRSARDTAYRLKDWVAEQGLGNAGLAATVTNDDTGRYLTVWAK